MNDAHSDPNTAEQIHQIKQNVRLEPSAWNQAAQHATLGERMAFYATSGLSVAVIKNGQLAWARGYGVVEAGRPSSVAIRNLNASPIWARWRSHVRPSARYWRYLSGGTLACSA